MKRLLIMSGLLLLSVVGCRKTESQPTEVADIPVSFSIEGIGANVVSAPGSAIASTGQSQLTRATEPEPEPEPEPATEQLDEGATVRIVIYKRAIGSAQADLSKDKYVGELTYVVDGAGNLVPCVLDGTGNVTEDPVDILYLTAGLHDFYAMTPGLVSADHKTVEVTNQMDYAASLTSANVVPQPDDAPQEIILETLQRGCTKLVFSITRKADNVTRAEIQYVELEGITKSPGTAPLGGSPVTGDNSGTHTMPKGTPGPEAYQYSVSDIILPKDGSDFKLKMRVAFNGADPSDLEATIKGIAFNPGKRYTFDIYLTGKYVILELQITPWNTDAKWETSVGESPYVTIEIGKWEILEWSTDVGEDITFPIIAPDSWTSHGDVSTDVGEEA